MEDWKVEKVPVTVHLTREAAAILYQYAGERNRGYFLSQMLVALRQRDIEEGERVAREAQESSNKPQAPQQAQRSPNHPNKRKNRR